MVVFFLKINALTRATTKVRYRCRVTYDGTGFCGFQLQHNSNNNNNKSHQKQKQQRTVQGELETVLSRRFNRLVRVVGAGRTDAGVHSRGQAVHFDLYTNETSTITDNEKVVSLETTMNKMLPTDVRVWKVEQAPLPCTEFVNGKDSIHSWNVMRKCTGKLYSYRICTGNCMDPIDRHERWQLDWGHEIDPIYLQRILKHYEGTHDFQLFANALEQNERKTGKAISTIRTIHKVNLVHEYEINDKDCDDKDGDNDDDRLNSNSYKNYYRIDVYLEGALYKMVRNMVGVALDVCRGKMTEEKFLGLLNNPKDYIRKDNTAKPAPPQGLTLEHVFYPNDDF